jgi:hypothetical protein
LLDLLLLFHKFDVIVQLFVFSEISAALTPAQLSENQGKGTQFSLINTVLCYRSITNAEHWLRTKIISSTKISVLYKEHMLAKITKKFLHK